MNEARRNAIMKIIDEIKERGIFSSPRFDDGFRKINALHTYFVARKNKMEQSKISGAGSSGIYKSRWQFYEYVFLANFVTPRNTQSNLERCHQRNSERKTQFKAVSNKSKLSKNDGTNRHCQADLLIESGVEVLHALNIKQIKSEQSEE